METMPSRIEDCRGSVVWGDVAVCRGEYCAAREGHIARDIFLAAITGFCDGWK